MAKLAFQKINLSKILLIALVVRLSLLPWVYHGDVVVTYWWGKFAAEFGWRGYYDWLNFGGYGRPDQPMLNIYFDWGVRQLYLSIYNILWFLNVNIAVFPSKFMQWYFINGNQVLLKLPMVVSDIALIYFCYKFIVKAFNQRRAKIAAIVLTFYLPLVYNSAVWGSGDSIINLFGLLSIYCVWQKKYISSAFFFILSILYKSSLLIWIPIIVTCLMKNKINLKDITVASASSLIFIFLISAPFSPLEVNPLVWFLQTMATKVLPGAMPQLTANAFNFWALIFGLTPRLDELMIFGLISARNLSFLICLFFYLCICRSLLLNFSVKNLLFSLVNISLITFIFMTRMHERYSFPALIPLLLLCFYDKKYIKYFVVLTITHLLNVYNWWWYPSVPPLIAVLKTDAVIRLLSFVNLSLVISLFVNQLSTREGENS